MQSLMMFGTAFLLVVSLLGALEFGYRTGVRRAREEDARAASQIGAVQGALLGLLGLLLAFSFAAAGARFLERQDLITKEANAIGTAYLRADLIPDPYASSLRAALREYTSHRVEVSRHLKDSISAANSAEVGAFHDRMWSAARDGSLAKPESMMAVVTAVNDVIDFHATRVAAGKKHLPMVVMGLLTACSVLSIGVIGYSCGTGKRRRATLTMSLAMLIAAALWITIDLDHARSGILRLSDAPLVALERSLTR